MSLPVSQYEALLAEVRGLRRKAQRVQQLARPLIGAANTSQYQNDNISEPLDYTMESLLLNRHNRSNSPSYERASTSGPEHLSSEDECSTMGVPRGIVSRSSAQMSHMSVSSEPAPRMGGATLLDSLYHGAWPTVERTSMWNSEPASLGVSSQQIQQKMGMRENGGSVQTDIGSVMSFASSSGGVPLDRVLCSPDRTKWSSQHLEAKMDVVHSLLSMLGSQEHVDMGETLLALSTCPESCLAMRQSGCIPLLVQLVQSDKDSDTRKKAAQALHNLVNSQPDEKIKKREARILKLLEQTRRYIDALKNNTEFDMEESNTPEDGDKHPVQTIAHLMKLSFDEGHRQAICQLGGIHIIATLVEAEHTMHGSTTIENHCILMRRYACMALTNLTFGDSGNKALLCSFRDFIRALVVQLQSPSDELRQVTASVLRNLSWRADSTSKEILREVGSVMGLMKAAILNNKENTLKSILSALWNLSAHCTENKSEICAVDGALGFIVTMLTYKTPSKSLAIIENAGGILRNISSQIAVREDYREVLRQHNCLQILLDQLKSPSLTIVSNACGTLWNLSAKCSADQETLWEMGAPAMLRSLNHSKHKMIAMGSSAALKNLLSCRPQQSLLQQMDSTALSLNLPELPTLGARKQKAMMQDLDHTLSETYENIEKDSPIKSIKAENNLGIIEFIQVPQKSKAGSSSPEELNNAFASLNLNEPSTSYASKVGHKSRIPQNYGSASLPYVPQPTKRSNPCTFIPVRSKFSDPTFEDDLPEQPIDYSQKYPESKPSSSAKSTSSKDDVKNDCENFTIAYAETDLDQPTDYSLRYAEDDSDSDICDNSKQEYVQDTVKTYCTEGTPYETPYVFSNATSISDLRNVGNTESKQEIDNDLQKAKETKVKEVKNADEKDHCSTEDISEIDNRDVKTGKSEFSSGLMSPEKPVNYCEEGTPGYFSRVSSFGSGLDSIPATETIKKEVKSETNKITSTQKTEKENVEKSVTKTSSETKAVKFEQVVNYAEETPLMFSRSSSLASLDSIEQHSIHDDRSSVVSDFSRLTSGIVSPSELPDSPTQTVPPSPCPRKTNPEFPSTSKNNRVSSENKPQLAQKISQKPSVFEDNVTRFKEESTPIQFSTATSLSSLTIDDHEDNENIGSPAKTPDTKVLQQLSAASVEAIEQKPDHQEKKDKEKETSGSDDLNDDSEGDDDILAACISDGMQTNMQPPTATSTPSKLPMSNFKYQPGKLQSSTSVPMIRRSPTRHIVHTSNVIEDAPKTYCTEDTPAQMSRTGSNSNLSALSISHDNRSRKDYLSDDSSNLSGDNDNILAECIQSAMPNSKKDIKGSNSNLSALSIPHDNRSRKDYLSDDSSNLSGDNDNILTECIQSAMPKSIKDNKVTPVQSNYLKLTSGLPRRSQPFKHVEGTSNSPLAPNISPQSTLMARQRSEASKMPGIRERQQHQRIKERERRDNSLPSYLCIRDEVESYAVEGSPCHFSLRSSLSDLTVDGSIAGFKIPIKTLAQNETASTSKKEMGSGLVNKDKSANLNVDEQDNPNLLNRVESLSSLSIESLRSNEGDQALLEECIYSGMPTDKAEEALLKECIKAGMPETGSSENSKPLEYPNFKRSEAFSNPLGPYQKDELTTHRQLPNVEISSRSKNVNVASVAGSTAEIPPVSEACPEMSTTAAGVKEGLAPDRSANTENYSDLVGTHHPTLEDERTGTPADILPDKCSRSAENFLTDLRKSGSSKSIGQFLDNSFDNDCTFSHSDNCANIEPCFAKSCEESGNLVDNRMLDPDAMIESLDRFTAELVSQASHLNKDKDDIKQLRTSVNDNTNDNTWNEDSSPNEITFPSISGSAPNVITFESDKDESNRLEMDVLDGLREDEVQSNDFSSINTSTMTESTLIAIEACRMATVFKKEAEMSQSITSAASLELDSVLPPSQLNSLNNSAIGLEKGIPNSPKLISRKKTLPAGLLVKRALSNSLNYASSIESLDNHSLTNLDNLNPPSDMLNLVDMENSITSIASLPNEGPEVKPDFMINGVTYKNIQDQKQHPIFNVKQQYIASSMTSFNTDLECINPPSIFNEITDMCNSLADVQTEAIGSESIFEDCYTHTVDNTFLDEPTEFSDANSITPIQTDQSSAESTPKRSKNLSKSMMTKQRRNLARDRYKTYTVAAEMVMQEEAKMREESLEPDSTISDDFQTVNDQSEDTTYVSPTYTVESSKMTPKERRKQDRSRFETQVLDEAITSVLRQPKIAANGKDVEAKSSSCSPSPTRSKLSIRRNFMQKRLENKERFRTRTLSESSFGSPDISSASPPSDANDIHYLLQKEANLVLKTLQDSKLPQDEMLDCETLSLVSNDEDSEHNSGSSMNYRTYHKSWGVRNNNLPIISTDKNKGIVGQVEEELESETKSHEPVSLDSVESDEENNREKVIGKPKIIKPERNTYIESDDTINEEPQKSIRGKRKPLYSKSNINNKMSPKTIKPAKSVTSNLVKNITSTIKSGTPFKSVVNKQTKLTPAKPPVPITIRSSGYGFTRHSSNIATVPSKSAVSSKNTSPKHTIKTLPLVERQGTFTKDDLSFNSSPKKTSKIPAPSSRIPSFASKIAMTVTSKIPSGNNTTTKGAGARNEVAKSASSDRANRNPRVYNRSTSADSREPSKRMQPSSSTQSLKNEPKTLNGAVRKSGIPSPAQRSYSNTSLTSNGSGPKKQVTSKIASLWKKVEESKVKQQNNSIDKRIWIQNEQPTEPPKLIRSNTFENKDGVILRNKLADSDDMTPKRVSRLGSFIIMDENGDSGVSTGPSVSSASPRVDVS